MNRLQDQEGRRVRFASQGITVTDVKPSGLMAIRPIVSPVQKSKEGLYQAKKGPGISLSSVMVKVIKSALMEAAECNPADGKRSGVAAKVRLQPKSAFCAKYNAAAPARATCKKSMNILLPGCLESRNRLSALSLDSVTFAKAGKKQQRIKPDMTNYEFMHRLMSYSSVGFRDVRNERRTAKIQTLDAIPEES